VHHTNGSHRAANSLAAALAAVGVMVVPASARAQERAPDRSREASFTTGASFGDGGTSLALTAALGFLFSARVGIEFEAMYARKLDFTLDLCPPPRVCVVGGQLPVTGRSVSLVPELTLDLFPRTRRVRAYVRAGAGAGHVRQRWWFPAPPAVNPRAIEFTRSSLVAAFASGAGIGARLSSRFGLDAGVRWLVLFDEAGTGDSITPSGRLRSVRAGLRVSWRF
jgi:hypothetical protein